MTDQDRDKLGEFEDDPEGPPSAEELAEAERLRRALAFELSEDEPAPKGAELARAIVAAVRPEPIDPARNEVLIQKALAKAPKRRGTNVLYVAFGAATLAVAAAAAVLGIGSFGRDDGRIPEPLALAASRPADDLFTEKFPTTGGTSARVDRIAMARERDYRDNQFARWGIR
jgi:hypothetical protein